MAQPTETSVLDALQKLKSPHAEGSVVAENMIQGVHIDGGTVRFAIAVQPDQGAALEDLRLACEQVVMEVAGVDKVTAVLTADRPATEAQAEAPRKPAPLKPGGIGDVVSVIAVASGKGGVGKSTVAVNLALSLAAQGKSVGLLDADIYGPSVPRLLGLSGKPDSDGKVIIPHEKFGIKCMSMGSMVDEETAMIWRGPMVVSAIGQMINDVKWGTLDVLVLDLPPGTGDAQLTIAQKVPLAGSVVVSTPQDIALLDARRGIAMFDKVKVPTLGIVENMSSFVCPHCGEASHIFGHGGARQTAEDLNVDFLGEVPLHLSIRETSDQGTPIVVSQPDSAEAQAFMNIAAGVTAKLDAGQKTAPTINFS
jgi:ATP-binding protein involved in chromosome partitioning